MKVLLVAPQPFYADRGTPIGVFLRAKAFEKLGANVTLFTYPMGKDPELENVEIKRIRSIPGINSVPIGPSLRKAILDFFLFWKLFFHLLFNVNQYDFIDAFEEGGIFCLPLKYIFGLTLIYDYQSSLSGMTAASDIYGWYPLIVTINFFENMALKYADAVICMSEEFKEELETVIPTQQYFPIQYTAIDPFLRDRIEEESSDLEQLKDWVAEDKTTVVYTGSLQKYQRIELLLKALQRVESTRIQIIIAGGTKKNIEELKNKARQLAVTDRVKITGWVTDRDRIALLNMADVLISLRVGRKGVPMKLYSYLWAGKPMLLAKGGSHKSVFDEDEALWTEPNLQALAKRLEEIPDYDLEEWESVVSDKFENEYDFDAFVCNHEPIFKYVLNQKED